MPWNRRTVFATALVVSASSVWIGLTGDDSISAADSPTSADRGGFARWRSEQKVDSQIEPAVDEALSSACTGPSISQTLAPDVIEPAIGIGCIGNGVSAGLSMARSFVLSSTTSIGCVNFGVEFNGGGAWPVEVRLRVGEVEGPYDALITVASTIVEIPDGGGNAFYTATFPGGAVFTAGQSVVIELHTPSRMVADGGDGGRIILACNNDGETAPTFVRAPACTVQNFVPTAAIGYPQSHLVLTAVGLYAAIDCSGASTLQENEPCGVDINNGCHSTPTPLFGGIECGMSFCGDLTADANGTVYDVDWYTIFALGSDPLTKITVDVQSQMPVHVLIVNDDCNDLQILRGAENVSSATVEICVAPGTYRVMLAPAVLDGYPCGAPGRQYLLSVNCAPTTIRTCCDNESIPTDANGDPILPPEWDGQPPTIVDIDDDRGLVPDLYPQFDTSLDVWYGSLPCDPSIGNHVDPSDLADDPEDDLATIGVTGDPDEIMDDLMTMESQIAAVGTSEPDWLQTASTVGPLPPGGLWCPQPEGPYVFGGRDIVLVHGLRLEHLFDRFLNVPGADADWVPPTVFPGFNQNPQFYGSGYYKLKAEANWQDYIDNFLIAPGYKNRYLVVSYQCSGRLERAAHSMLTQIADAMRDGTGVVDLSGCGDISNFGSRSFVILSHSTGALVTDVAMHAAATKPTLGAGHIAQRCKAHIAPSGAFLGSHLATTAVGLSNYIPHLTVTWPACVLARESLKAFDPSANLPNCGSGPVDLQAFLTSLVRHSVLVDLVPANAQAKWGASIANTPVRTITAVAGHPTKISPLKFFLHRGFDDGVVNINCQVANSNPVSMHPCGFFPPDVKDVFDKGLREGGHPKRAKKYYKDQAKDKFLPEDMVAAGATQWVSPSGLLQPTAQTITPLRDPQARYANHFSYLQSAASHPTAIRVFQNYPHYDVTNHIGSVDEENTEETRVLTNPAVYANYAAGFNDNAPLLSNTCMKQLRELVRGARIQFKIRIFGKTFRVDKWIWKRTYHLLEGTLSWHQIHYIHHSILCQPLDCSGVNCNPTPCPGDANGTGSVDIDDLLAVIGTWGATGKSAGDVDGNSIVNIDDLLSVIGSWGDCPG